VTIADVVSLVKLGTAIDARRSSAPPASVYGSWRTKQAQSHQRENQRDRTARASQ
jgi:hypothetical protein